MVSNFSTFEPCIVCEKVTENGNCHHHLYTRKAFPTLTDVRWNKIPVCQEHHNEFHNKGTKAMAEKSIWVKNWLLKEGWEYNDFMGWHHEEAFKTE